MSTRISASMAKYSMGNPPFRRATNNKKLFPPIESLTKLHRGQPPCRNADCSAGAEPLGYLSIFVENCQEIKKPLDKLQAAVYNINVKRLCSKRLPSLSCLKNNRTQFGRWAVIFYCFYSLKILCMHSLQQESGTALPSTPW